MSNNTTDPMAEIAAMKVVAEELSKLDLEATARVLQWAAGRFEVVLTTKDKRANQGGAKNLTDEGLETGEFEDFSDLFSSASPKTDADKALVAGYWVQFKQGEEDFPSQAIHSALKQLGHGVSNITQALESLKAQNPALVMQVRKSGTTKQARKKYKLTSAGKKAVEMLIRQE